MRIIRKTFVFRGNNIITFFFFTQTHITIYKYYIKRYNFRFSLLLSFIFHLDENRNDKYRY